MSTLDKVLNRSKSDTEFCGHRKTPRSLGCRRGVAVNRAGVKLVISFEKLDSQVRFSLNFKTEERQC